MKQTVSEKFGSRFCHPTTASTIKSSFYFKNLCTQSYNYWCNFLVRLNGVISDGIITSGLLQTSAVQYFIFSSFIFVCWILLNKYNLEHVSDEKSWPNVTIHSCLHKTKENFSIFFFLRNHALHSNSFRMKTFFFSHELGLPEFFRIWCEIELRIPPFQKRGVKKRLILIRNSNFALRKLLFKLLCLLVKCGV